MEVKISNPRAIKAAASLANGGYTTSVFQIRREEGSARVSGTNGYASISVLVPATFSRWPEGKSLTFGGDGVRSMMRGIGRSLKSAETASLSFLREGTVTASAESEGTTTQTRFNVRKDRFLDKLADYDWTRGKPPANAEGGKVHPHSMKIASQAFEYLSLDMPVELQASDDGRTYAMTADDGDIHACAVIVRSRYS